MDKLNNTIYRDISSLNDLFISNSNLIFRNKNFPLNFIQIKNPTNQTLFRIKNCDHEIEFIDSLSINEDYVLKVSDKRDQISEIDIFTYFHYLGKLIGQFAFYLNFDRLTEINHLDDKIIKTKANLTILLRNFNDYAKAFDDLLQSENDAENDSYNNEYVYFIMKLKEDFVEVIDSLDIYSKEKLNYVQPSTLLALNYIGLTYSLIGSLILKLETNTITSLEFIKRCASSSTEQTLQTLISSSNEVEYTKLLALAYLWKIMDQYYMHGFNFKRTFSENIVHNCLLNIGDLAYNKAFDSDSEQGKIIIQIVRNNLFDNAISIEGFCDIASLADLSITSSIDDENENHIYYFKTLDNFIKTQLVNGPNFLTIFETGSQIAGKNSLFNGFSGEFSLKKAKKFIEYVIANESKIVSPKVIFKLLAIAGYARYRCYHSLRIRTTPNNKINEPEYCPDVIIMAETAVYNMYQEWFNRTDKMYRFEKRNFSYNPLYEETIQDSLKNEILITLIDYSILCLSLGNSETNIIKRIISDLPDLNELTASLHEDFRNAYPTIHSYKEIYAKMEILLQSSLEYPALTDYIINPEYGKIGIIPILLYAKDKDTLLDLMESNITLNDFFAQMESNSETPNDMKNFIEKISPNEEILGTNSNSEIYKRINTNAGKIISSGLLWSYIFYLTYGLNYIYIKHNEVNNFAENFDPNVIPMESRDEIVLNDQSKLLSIENKIRLVFKSFDKNKNSDFTKYGFRS